MAELNSESGFAALLELRGVPLAMRLGVGPPIFIKF